MSTPQQHRKIIQDEEFEEEEESDVDFYREVHEDIELEHVQDISLIEFETQKWAEEERLRELSIKPPEVKKEEPIDWQKTIQLNYKEFEEDKEQLVKEEPK